MTTRYADIDYTCPADCKHCEPLPEYTRGDVRAMPAEAQEFYRECREVFSEDEKQ